MRTGKHILLVEDDEDDQSFFLEAIQKIDTTIRVTIAVNGRDALQQLESLTTPPDLVFLDINMPMVNGLECLGRIRKLDHLDRVPVFILSTSGDPVSVSMAKRLGADGYLTKPFEREALLMHLKQVLSLDLTRPRAERDPAFLQLLTHKS